jgi:hypothetical protein
MGRKKKLVDIDNSNDSSLVNNGNNKIRKVKDFSKGDKTKLKYNPKVEYFKNWVSLEHPYLVDEKTGELLLISGKQLEDYLEEKVMYKEDKTLKVTNSVYAYWSAIKYYYEELRNPIIRIDLNSDLQRGSKQWFEGEHSNYIY